MLLLRVVSMAAAAAAASGALKLDFAVLRGKSAADAVPAAQGGLRKRADGYTEVELTNEQTYYSVDLSVGSDGQSNTVLIDTGLSDLWIMAAQMTCASLSSYKRDSYARFRALDEQQMQTRADGPDAARAQRRHRAELAAQALRKRRADLADQMVADADKHARRASYIEITVTEPGFGSAVATATADDTATAAANGANTCTSFGSFNTDTSDSFKVNSSADAFSISYADGTFAEGYWAQDTLGLGSANILDANFAVVNYTDLGFGVFGIGLEGLESTFTGYSSGYTYQNVPVQLKAQGVIHKTLYSLYLNTADALKGSVLFGAVDHAKYSGTLQTVPVVNVYAQYYDNPIRLDVVLDSITLESSSLNVSVTSSHIPALLDSGTTFTYLPTSILSAFVSLMSGSYSLSAGLYRVSCNYDSSSLYAIFNFSGAEIKVPLSDLIVTYSSQCYLGVLEQSSTAGGYEYAVLGDNFLRNAYLVYDLEDYQVSLAQAKYTDDEDVEVVTSSVPLAVSAALYSATALDASLTLGQSTSTLSGSSSSGSNRDSPALRVQPAHVAMIVAFAAVGVALV